jgi:peptidyl-prolyl cis-trans isomerase SurA
MHDFYTEHVKEFDAPAQVTWREVLIEVGKSKSRADARRRADAALERIRGGEGLAAVAKAVSDGPNKAEGGLWKLVPGSYGVPAVSAVLDTLAVGEVSPVIEGRNSYHIVCVEGRRAAGPETFAAVQDKIKIRLRAEKIQRESTALLNTLRSQSVIINYLNPTDPTPPVTASLRRATEPTAT